MVIVRFVLAMCAALAALTISNANAAQALRGTVLTVLPAKQEAVVRHEAYGGMPAMSMLFKLSPRDTARLHEGDRIEATVDERTDGESLSNVRVVQAPPVAPPADALRSVTLLNTGDKVPSISLIDQNGRPFTPTDFRGKIVVMSFVYTRCRDT